MIITINAPIYPISYRIFTNKPTNSRTIIPSPQIIRLCFLIKVNAKQRYCHIAIICKPQILHYKPIAKPMTNIQYEYNIIKSQGIYKLCKNKLYITLYDTSLFVTIIQFHYTIQHLPLQYKNSLPMLCRQGMMFLPYNFSTAFTALW